MGNYSKEYLKSLCKRAFLDKKYIDANPRSIDELLKVHNVYSFDDIERYILSDYFCKDLPYSQYYVEPYALFFGNFRYYNYYNFFIHSNLLDTSYTKEKEEFYEKFIKEQFECEVIVNSSLLNGLSFFEDDYLDPRMFLGNLSSLMLGNDSYIYVLMDCDTNTPAFFFNGFYLFKDGAYHGEDEIENFFQDEERMELSLKLDRAEKKYGFFSPQFQKLFHKLHCVDEISDYNECFNSQIIDDCLLAGRYLFGDKFIKTYGRKCISPIISTLFSYAWEIDASNFDCFLNSPEIKKRNLNLELRQVFIEDSASVDLNDLHNQASSLRETLKKLNNSEKRDPILFYSTQRQLAYLNFKIYLKQYYNTIDILDNFYLYYLYMKEKNYKNILNDTSGNSVFDSKYVVDFDKFKEEFSKRDK